VQPALSILPFDVCIYVLYSVQAFHINMLNERFVSESGAETQCTVGDGFWTAGQRVDPSRVTPFVWKPITSGGQQQLPMTYTNWLSGQPDNWGAAGDIATESCVNIWVNYQFNDAACYVPLCYLCEYDVVKK